ncbi:hypothetical protein HNR19_003372 [Nocardioides thalensis]|uniref:Uncharacterized protein n=1 Tax=Nocardioides thalensis TaxID=1914755 RepID=A0A853C5C8_9ACTN|nr:hypothetical protein [Nocardioides thalensis]NYJ02674.1 hypothetical protein [Nocardioides thalensis]
MFGFGGWQTGTATVVARRLLKEWRSAHTEHSRGMKRRKFEFILDVHPDDGSPRFRATCKDSVFDPVQGDTVPVLCKPTSEKVKLDAGRLLPGDRKAPRRSAAEDARWQRMKSDEPGSTPP